MARSHPPTLLTLATRALQRELRLPAGTTLLAAVSGGPDSMALVHVLARLREKLGFRLVAHGVDHGLRAEAAAGLHLAQGLAQSLDVPFARTRVDVAPGGNLQARARAARYQALRAAAALAGADVIATAHHADDRAETVLLRLLRGAGPRGLAVLPPRSGDLVRPFLRARRESVLAHVARHGVPCAEDPSNLDPRFLRVRVRRELMPLLVALSPAVVEHLNALADQLLAQGPASVPEGRGTPLLGPDLPRRVRDALAALPHASTKARVALAGGLVATYHRGQLECRQGDVKQSVRRRKAPGES